jgi:transposase-like protein
LSLLACPQRALDKTPYVMLDAPCECVREVRQLVDSGVLVAVGVTANGHRNALDAIAVAMHKKATGETPSSDRRGVAPVA